MQSNPKSAPEVSGRGHPARIAELSVGYLTIIGFLFYPIGVLVLALQLWNAYSYGLGDALYAASLVPIVPNAVRILDFLFWAFLAMGGAQQISSFVAWRRQREELAEILERLPDMKRTDFRRQDRSDRAQRRMTGISFLLLITAPFALQLIYFNSWRTWVLYVLFVILTCVGGVAAGLVALYVGEEPFVSLSSNWRATLIAYGFGILAGIAMTGSSIPSLPTIQFGTSAQSEGRLLVHKEGYWYVFDSQGAFRAVSDGDAGGVRFLDRPSESFESSKAPG